MRAAAALVAGVLEELVDALLDVDEGGEVSVAEVDGLSALELEAVVVGHRKVLSRRGRCAVRCCGRSRRCTVAGASKVAMVLALRLSPTSLESSLATWPSSTQRFDFR